MLKPTNSGYVLIVGTLDTKGQELLFLRECLAVVGVPIAGGGCRRARRTKLCRGRDTGRNRRRGRRVGRLPPRSRGRGRPVAAMDRGFAAWCHAHPPADLWVGVVATVATAGMRQLPIGVPKLIVSSMASGDVRPCVGTSDICMMYSVADFTGLDHLTRAILANAAHAMAGMCSLRRPAAAEDRTLLGATIFGVTTPCVNGIGLALGPVRKPYYGPFLCGGEKDEI